MRHQVITVLLVLLPVVLSSFMGTDPTTLFTPIEGYSNMLFYWLFPSKSGESPPPPLVIYFEGGPGRAPEFSIFLSIGPLRVDGSGKIVLNEDSWSNIADLLFIDQPLGTGFSFYNDEEYIPKDMKMVMEDLWSALDNISQDNPKYLGRDIYFYGGTYSAHVALAAGEYFLSHPVGGMQMRGVGLADGLIDATLQLPYEPSYAYKYGLINYFERLLSTFTLYLTSLSGWLNWEYGFNTGLKYSWRIIEGWEAPRFNPYNFKLPCPCPHAPLKCYNFTAFYTLMEGDYIKTELELEPQRIWKPTNPIFAEEMVSKDIYKSYSSVLASLLNKGIRVVMSVGIYDYVLNWESQYAVLRYSGWKDFHLFDALDYDEWRVDGELLALKKEYKNLLFVREFGAGHLSLMDNPSFSLNLLQHLIRSSD